jgi:hypothetical protein
MKAQELRVGNLVWVDTGIYNRLPTSITALSRELFRCKDGIFSTVKFEPIPVDEDWLLRFGFKKRNDKTFTYDRFILYFVSKYEFWYMNDRRTNVYFTKVEFVHELQNIIFAMNGEELEVKV